MNYHGGKFLFLTFFIFFINKIFRFDRNTRLNHLVVSNNVFILHLNDKTLQRRCLDDIQKDTKASAAFQGLILIHLQSIIANIFCFINRSSN